jgi:CBS domain containing-hemolysin-like protein
MAISSLVGIVAVVALIAANGFFVAGEFALVKIRSTRINQLAEEGNRTAKIIQAQLEHLDTYIAATQLEELDGRRIARVHVER